MLTKLSKSQQKALLKALPAHRKQAVKNHCNKCQMSGEGIGDILKSIGSVLGPIIREVGPTVLKEFILPFIKHKVSQRGSGLKLSGGGTRLAGGGRRVKKLK